jgi:acylphosphatase
VATKIEEFSGTIKGLSSEQLAKADVDLTGKVDKYAPFKIKGQINPLSEDAYTDVSVVFENLNLTTISPYSGKYAGYPITKGKLSLDLAYKLSQKELVGENKVLVDQITMGSEVESPDATSLPIPLALALLKDRKGLIDIDLPISGNIDEPDFSYGGIIWQALVNLITKIATSPFSLVGGLVGGVMGDDPDALKYIAFSPSEIEMPSPEQEKLVALGKALADRPGLRLDITGTADSKVDGSALAEAKLLTQLKKAKFVQQPPSGDQASASVEKLELTPEEEAQYLKQLFVEKFGESALTKAAETPDAKKSKADPRPLTADEMKAKLLEGIVVDEAQLRVLAQERAQQIREYLIQEGKVPSNQVFLVEVVLNPTSEEGMVRSPLALAAN